MGSWILPLVLAGTGTAVAGGEARRVLGVTARVVESCTIARGGAASVSCTRGTSWTRGEATAPASTGSTGSTPAGVRYLTITY